MQRCCFICGVVKCAEPVSFHRFPKDSERIESWMNFFGIPFDLVSNYHLEHIRLCSRHFQVTDFAECGKTKKKRVLLGDADPTIKLENNETFRKRLRLSNFPNQRKKQRKSTNNNVDDSQDQSMVPKKYWPKTCVICRLQTQLSLSYFRFPKDNRRQLWLAACNMDSVTDGMRLCSRHFTMDSFARLPGISKRPALKNTAIPTLYLTETSGTIVHQGNEDQSENDIDPLDIDCVKTEPNETEIETIWFNAEHDLDIPDRAECSPNALGSEESPELPPSGRTSPGPLYMETPQTPIRTPRYPGDICLPHFSSPRRAQKYYMGALNIIKELRQQLKVAKQKVRRRDQRLLDLKDVVKELQQKNLIDGEVSDNLISIIGKPIK